MKLPHIEGRFTWPDFPEQDWKLWEARKFSRPPDGATIDTNYMDTRPCCIHCATWICAGCWDYRRSRATRAVSQYCARCGSIEGFFSAVRHYHDHEALPMVPFLVPVINDERASIVRQLEEALGDRLKARAAADRVFSTACPAGDPCPATGCPACCPSYDPCGEKSCRNCNPGGEMHVPEEANMADEALTAEEAFDLTEDEARERGFLPPKPSEDQGAPDEVLDKAEPILPHVVTMATDTIREAYARGASPDDKMVLCIAEVQELCNLAVQTRYSDSHVVEEALKKVLAEARRRDVTDKDRELIAKNAKASIERRDAERAKRLGREMAMDWSVRLHEKALSNGQIVGTPSVISGAQQILDWMTDGKMPPGA